MTKTQAQRDAAATFDKLTAAQAKAARFEKALREVRERVTLGVSYQMGAEVLAIVEAALDRQ